MQQNATLVVYIYEGVKKEVDMGLLVQEIVEQKIFLIRHHNMFRLTVEEVDILVSQNAIPFSGSKY